MSCFFSPMWVVFCALSAHHLFVSAAGCRIAFDGIPHVHLPPVICCLSCSQPEIAYHFKIKPEFLPKLPGEMRPEGRIKTFITEAWCSQVSFLPRGCYQ